MYSDENQLPHDPADLLDVAYQHAMAAKAAGVAIRLSPNWLVTKVENGVVKPCEACLAGSVMLGLQYVPRFVQLYEQKNKDVVGPLTQEQWSVCVREPSVIFKTYYDGVELLPGDGKDIGVSPGDIANLNALNKYREGRLLEALEISYRPCDTVQVLAAEWHHKLGCRAETLFAELDDSEEEGALESLNVLPQLSAAYRKIAPSLRKSYVSLRRNHYGPGGGEV